jgi:hypothetical protein
MGKASDAKEFSFELKKSILTIFPKRQKKSHGWDPWQNDFTR